MDNKMKIIDEVERFIGNKLDEIRNSEELNKDEKLEIENGSKISIPLKYTNKKCIW